jgi:hypothetical protein
VKRRGIDQCAAQPGPHPTIGTTPLDIIGSCPLSYDIPYTITDTPHWTIDNYPTITLQPHDDGTITVDTTTPGHATLTYRWTLDIVTPQRWTTNTTDTHHHRRPRHPRQQHTHLDTLTPGRRTPATSRRSYNAGIEHAHANDPREIINPDPPTGSTQHRQSRAGTS